jgi:diaminohydroxyphosphoribosylaminopyrimidine deaminase / 5-amino-6-(5-phosphoribosylamino)uracil reductase
MNHDLYMRRCLELAKRGKGNVSPNPMVGAVLVYNKQIIGEGWHQQFGEAHAEVNCIAAVKAKDQPLIAQSILYVSMEPCAHFGKTPPCTNLIIENKISSVVIGCRDPNVHVSGGGLEKLQAAGVKMITGVLETECKNLNKRFFTFCTMRRPYIILKWAQTGNKKISSGNRERLLISNEYSNRLVHKWRSEEASILVGTNTALMDDPALTNRYWEGPSPVKLVIDMDLKLPASLKIFNSKHKTIVFNSRKHNLDQAFLRHSPGRMEEVNYYQITTDVSLVHQVVNALYHLNIQSVMVEGGATLLQSFIDEGMWDEARVITNTKQTGATGLPAPVINNAEKIREQKILNDTIENFRPKI